MSGLAMAQNKIPDFTEVIALDREQADATADELLRWGLDRWGDRLVVASSFGAEDVVLVDLVASIDRNARIFTLDTGRLHQETYDVMERLRRRYDIKFEVVTPRTELLQPMLQEKGPNSFYESVDARKECCNIRKMEPLRRVLATADAWVTGIRRGQSVTRTDAPRVTIDVPNGGIYKLNPLANWSEDDVWNHIRDNDVPYNSLHDCGFPSIGCTPCTRAIKPGEDVRAGRWWWEDPTSRECGLHARASTDSANL